MRDDENRIELIGVDADDGLGRGQEGAVSKQADRRMVTVLAILALVAVGGLLLRGGDEAGQSGDRNADPVGTTPPLSAKDERINPAEVIKAIPAPLVAAEDFAADPSAAGLRNLFAAVGGVDDLQVATAQGVFDLVRFDPNEPDRLLASRRLSYGPAENQATNEVWHITGSGEVEQLLWEPSIRHDFVHFNVDGTATMWVHSGEPGFAPRVATILNRGFEPSTTTEPLYASRFTAAGGAVFALTGNGDYYTNEAGYVDLVADRGTGPLTLDSGAAYEWIDNPIPELLLAYPNDRNGSVNVWNTATFEPVPTHPLAGRAYRRVAISGDQTIAVGATFDDELEVIDLVTGVTRKTFGRVEVTGVDQPITLNKDGTIAITVERTGQVSLWWVGDDTPIVAVAAHEGQPRWVSEEHGPRSTSVVSPDTTRVALLTAARAETPTSWRIIDTNPTSWVERACEIAGRPLTREEEKALGLPTGQRVCVGQQD